MNYLLLAKYLGYIAFAVGVTMVPVVGCALWYDESMAVMAFAGSAGICAIIGLALRRAGRDAPETMYQRESLALVGFTWILAAGLGALPFMLSGTLPSPIDAYFESMSGFTTTGSTVLVDIEGAPLSILLWRSITQWVGGIGIVVVFIAVLPYLGAGGKQLFSLEAPGPESKTFRPQIRDTAKFLLRLYVGLTLTMFVLLCLEGMMPFEALCHTLSTVSTGGFSTRQGSIGAYDSALIELTVTFFMVIAAINFGLFFAALRGHGRALWRDAELRVFLGILGVAILLMTLNLMGLHGNPGARSDSALEREFEGVHYEHIEEKSYPFGEALRKSVFQAASIMTTTGFVTDDFDVWPHFSRSLLLLLMFVGGCAGSTAGGFKVVRIIMLLKMAYWRLEQSFRPKTFRALRVGDEVVEEGVQRRLSGFFVLYLVWFLVGTLLMSAFGLPFETATTAVIATMNNIGPGLGLVGANMDFHLLPAVAKMFLTFCMVLGRLEIFTICVLLMPTFWRGPWTH